MPPYAVAGIVIAVALTGCAIGLALLVLTWVERNRALLVLTVAYLAVVLVPIDFGWATALLGGIGFALPSGRSAHPPSERGLRSPRPPPVAV